MLETRPTLVYDGDCAICRYWVRYWQTLVGDRVIFRPYQEAAAEFPAISVDAFKRAIQLIELDGTVHSGAAATYRVLRRAPGRSAWWWLYVRAPGFARVAEWSYAFFARRRGLLGRVTYLLWGRALEAERYELVSWTFLRLLGAIYLAAFVSLAVQISGLVGHDGIAPLRQFLERVHEDFGGAGYAFLPTLFWFDASDTALHAVTLAGAVLAVLVVLDVWTRAALIALFVLYLSCVYAGQDFMAFQWDLLLLEAGFLGIFLTSGSRIVVWLYRWLLLRYLFMAGVVKIASGDPTWRNLTALEYHFWTQPLPAPLAWYAAQLPHPVLAFSTAAALAVEVVLVFLILFPRRLRFAVAWCTLLFQFLIVLTGNYNFFNLLTMSLCLLLFDDAAVRRWFPKRLASVAAARAPTPGRMATTIATVLALIVVPVGVNRVWHRLTRGDLPVAGSLSRAVDPLLMVNPYGLFAVMTTARPEVVIEGSDDGKVWREYAFRYKPGPLERGLRWNIPHQPRLDWQMWFAALGDSRENPWFDGLMRRLLEGSPQVLSLLAATPFPDHPPKYVRAQLYEYRFADPALHGRTGQWWVRDLAGTYFPETTLADFGGGDLPEGLPPPAIVAPGR